MNIADATTFFGWCSILGMSLLVLSGLGLAAMQTAAIRIHSALYDIPEERLKILYFDYLGRLKLLVLVFGVIPYCALKIMG